MKRSVKDQDVTRLALFFARWSELPASELERLSGTFTVNTLAKGEQLVRVGDPPLRVAFVLSGILRAYYVTPNGAEFVRNFIEEDEIAAPFGSVITNEASNLIVEALEDVEVLSFDTATFRALFAQHHAWSELGRRLAERYYVLRERHAHQLLTLAGRERYQAFVKASPQLARRVPQKHIAGYLGMTPVSLNRVIASAHKKRPR